MRRVAILAILAVLAAVVAGCGVMSEDTAVICLRAVAAELDAGRISDPDALRMVHEITYAVDGWAPEDYAGAVAAIAAVVIPLLL